jgi:hypothetical protein
VAQLQFPLAGLEMLVGLRDERNDRILRRRLGRPDRRGGGGWRGRIALGSAAQGASTTGRTGERVHERKKS